MAYNVVKRLDIVLIGAGNLATNLGKELYKKGYKISQVYSRTESSARQLANILSSAYTTSLDELANTADLYIVSLKDSAFIDLVPAITHGREKALFVHTAGSIPLEIWHQSPIARYGVLYPMQTFSKECEVEFKNIPFFIEAGRKEDLYFLKDLAGELSTHVYEINSEQRKHLHLAAVFACNFTNHMYALAATIVDQYQLPFEILLPLIEETVRKVHYLGPQMAQTGPAVRYDQNVINNHLELLKNDSIMQEIYEKLSKSIYQMKLKEQ